MLLVSMRLRILACLLVAFIAFTLVPRVVTSQGTWAAEIVKTEAPGTVVAGQPLTVIVTVSYSMDLLAGQSLFVAIEDRNEIVGKPFPNHSLTVPGG